MKKISYNEALQIVYWTLEWIVLANKTIYSKLKAFKGQLYIDWNEIKECRFDKVRLKPKIKYIYQISSKNTN